MTRPRLVNYRRRMTIQVNVYEAKTQLSELLKQAEAGEDVVIARSGRPVVRLVPVERRSGQRPGRGSLKGKVWISEDFDKVDDEIIEEFEQALGQVLP